MLILLNQTAATGAILACQKIPVPSGKIFFVQIDTILDARSLDWVGDETSYSGLRPLGRMVGYSWKRFRVVAEMASRSGPQNYCSN